MELKFCGKKTNDITKTTFNRTIWNWNSVRNLFPFKEHTLLIELYGIEISSCQTGNRP